MDNILEDSNIAFHGINFDYFKMLSILQTGILSQNSAALLGISIDRNYGGFNGNSQVSLSESPSIHGTYNHGAFKTYIKDSISFVIDTSNIYCIPDTKSGIPGEVYVNNSVSRENIVGIMLPEQHLQTGIDKLNIFGNIGTGYIDSYALNLVDKINYFFKTNFSKEEIINCIEMKKNLSGDFFDKMNQEEVINKTINEIITKYFDLGFRATYNYQSSPALIDVVNILTDGKIPIYDTSGNLIIKTKNKIM